MRHVEGQPVRLTFSLPLQRANGRNGLLLLNDGSYTQGCASSLRLHAKLLETAPATGVP